MPTGRDIPVMEYSSQNTLRQESLDSRHFMYFIARYDVIPKVVAMNFLEYFHDLTMQRPSTYNLTPKKWSVSPFNDLIQLTRVLPWCNYC